MTAPVWMAFPPEVHSTLLSSGPGPAGLLASAASWSSLSETYAEVADELSQTLSATQAGAWEGPSADEYVAAHVPYLVWLVRASANSAAMASQQEVAATAYTAAVAAMPTLPELAANHAIHGALLATNFFGINTIPIALNEADYARMWAQAAATMTTYQTVATTAVAATPQTDPAPQIVKTDGAVQTGPGTTGGSYGGDGNADQGILPIVDNDAGDPDDLSWWINRFLEPFQTLARDLQIFEHNPIQGLTQLWYDIGGVIADEWGHLIQVFQYFPQLLLAPLLVPAAAAAPGLASLTALSLIEPDAIPAPAAAAAPAPHTPSMPAAVSASAPMSAAATAPAPSTAPTSAPAPTTATATATAATPTPPGFGGPPFPYLVGGPRIGAGMGMSSGAQRKASEPDSSAAAAAASASAADKQRARRRRRAAMQDHYRGFEFMDLDSGPALTSVSQAVASERGAGPLGFAGTAVKERADAAGLTTLAGDEFGGGPALPMLPGTWEPDQRGTFARRRPTTT